MAFVSGSAKEDESGMRSTWRIGGSEVREVVEGLIKRIWKEVEGQDLPGWFRVMPYDVAMDVVSLVIIIVTPRASPDVSPSMGLVRF